ncbi:BLUF domain-containing protein [Mucilaginibacter paludis]|uniref:BLUF domain-containing protein n=1 Tax=Mucilaginibacter paludis TaxID=423351 RepID=UPI0002F1F03D|nr:BLUF domain-containing protein [Mucilaginibacter paludis]
MLCTGIGRGDALAVETIYQKIKRDSRHKNIIELAQGQLTERIFPFWSMGFKAISNGELEKFEAYANPEENSLWDKDADHPALIVLKTFALSNRL